MDGLLATDLLVCSLAVILGACVQGTSGIGFALVAAPLIALVRPDFVPGAMLALGATVSAFAATREHRSIDYRAAGIALAGRVPGAIIAGAVIGLLPLASFVLLFAAMILLAVISSVAGWRVRPTSSSLAAAGFASGFMGTITSIGTPPIGIVMQHEEPRRLRATIGLFLFAGAIVSIVVLAMFGRFGWHDIRLALLLLVPLAIGFKLSSLIVGRVGQQTVRRAVLGLCVFSAFLLIFKHGWARDANHYTLVAYLKDFYAN